MHSTSAQLQSRYDVARDIYAEWGVDTDAALNRLSTIAISLNCWQGDDLTGFEIGGGLSDGGILATGNYPGRARTAEELRQDLDLTYRLIPGKHRLNLHAIYGEFNGETVKRTDIGPEHFTQWIEWGRMHGLGFDFNQTFFSHPKAADGFTLTSRDNAIRSFWIEHGKRCRHIGETMGRALGTPCITNIWIPDGYKDMPIDRKGPRERLCTALDAIFSCPHDSRYLKDAVECKLFGIGSESCVFGSHEFYLGYALKNNIVLCLDSGHFHPTEVISDKLSAILCFLDEILLHVSRGVRWDSDHVVILNDELQAITNEIVRNDYLDRVNIGLDFFDASINRIAAWTIGTRSVLKAMLMALLEPTDHLRELEDRADYTGRLALLEELKTLPHGVIWDYHCDRHDVPVGRQWLSEVRRYEADVLSKR